MENKYGIDSHKLMYHPERVAQFKNNELVSPISMELSLTGGCNHRCIFCSADYLGHNTAFVDKTTLMENMKVLSENGLKSVYLAGSGEPLLHPDVVDIIKELKVGCGLDVALSSNGVLLTSEIAEKILPYLSWVRLSFNAIRKETYNYIHQGREDDLETVIRNVNDAVALKRRKGLEVTLGIQAILIQENYDEMEEMALKLKELGADYFTVKALLKDNRTAAAVTADFTFEELKGLEERLDAVGSEQFDTIVRIRTMSKRLRKDARNFNRCFALPFSFFMDADGGLWSCCTHVGDEAFYYGNIKEGIITKDPEIFFRRTREVSETRDISKCPLGCRFEYMNEYLYSLRSSSKHVNFI